MATIKSHTDLPQSKTLSKILPIESADMSWASNGLGKPFARTIPIKGDPEELCACWSLASLLDVLPKFTIDSSDDHYFRIHCQQKFSEWHDNLIAACYEMLLKLHELNLL